MWDLLALSLEIVFFHFLISCGFANFLGGKVLQQYTMNLADTADTKASRTHQSFLDQGLFLSQMFRISECPQHGELM